MKLPSFSYELIIREAKLSPEDVMEIQKRRRNNNRLVFACQLAFDRLTNRFPKQQPMEVVGELLTLVAVQLDISPDAIEVYRQRRQTIAEHRSTAIECTDRDAAYVLDGLLYNESDLALEEHYTDTHGYTEINFAAFALLGRRFAPHIRGLQHQRIYKID